MDIENLDKPDYDIDLDAVEDPNEYHYYYYCYNNLKSKREQSYLLCKNFYDYLCDPATYLEKHSFISKLENDEYKFLNLIIEIALDLENTAKEEADYYAFCIFHWFIEHFDPNEFPFLYSSQMANLIIQYINLVFEKSCEDKTIVRIFSIFELFIRHGGKIEIENIEPNFNFFLALLSKIRDQASIHLYIANALFILGAFVSQFGDFITEPHFLQAFQLSCIAMQMSHPFIDGTLRFWLDSLQTRGCDFLDFINIHSSIKDISLFITDGSIDFQHNLFSFFSYVATNSSETQFNILFSPNIEWSLFPNVSLSEEFDAISYCDCIHCLMKHFSDLIETFYNSKIFDVFIDILNDDDSFSIRDRQKALYVLLYHVSNMNLDMICEILEKCIEQNLNDLIDSMNNKYLNNLIYNFITILQKFESQDDTFKIEISQRWNDLGLFSLFQDIIDDPPEDNSRIELFEELISDFQNYSEMQ